MKTYTVHLANAEKVVVTANKDRPSGYRATDPHYPGCLVVWQATTTWVFPWSSVLYFEIS
jgi:ribosomal protein L13